jgi:transposase
MRGQADEQVPLFHVFKVEDRIRRDHPLRNIKLRADRILAGLAGQFAAAYSLTGRPSVPPERLLKAMLLMSLYSIRSERQLCEAIDVNLLFRWFLDMQPSEEAFDATTFTKNRQRLDDHDLTRSFFAAVVTEALTLGLCSEHFSVDGTMIESYAAAKSFQPKDADKETPKDPNGFQPRNAEVDFHGQKRSNETHTSRTDPEAKLHRKGPGKEAKLSHMGHVLNENRHGLIMEILATEANGTAERSAALDMIDELKAAHAVQPKTIGADKGYDSGEFFQELETRQIEPHVPLVKTPTDPEKVVHEKRRPGVDSRHRMKERMASEAYRLSQKCRKKVEECFGWLKTIAGLDRSRTVGRWKLQQALEMGAAAFNLVRLVKLGPAM